MPQTLWGRAFNIIAWNKEYQYSLDKIVALPTSKKAINDMYDYMIIYIEPHDSQESGATEVSKMYY